MSKNKISPLDNNWDAFEKTIFAPEEIAASNLRIALVNEIIVARQERGMTQKELEAASGVRQPIIARLEKGSTDPQLSTLLKVLAAVDKTLAIVPLQK